MAKPNRIKELEKEYGDLHKVIPKLVNTGGQQYAAFQLGVSIATISNWLKTNGYRPTVTYALTDDARRALESEQPHAEPMGL